VQQFISQYGFMIAMALLLVLMMTFSSRTRRKMAEQQAERERQLTQNLVPGVWVKTAVGFWGRFVDQDGDIVILETSNGTETYWDRSMIREVADHLPFASEETESSDTDGDTDEDEPILGMDRPSTTN
jgi:Preprotein translocase subunit.